MIHFPEPWLKLIQSTATVLTTNARLDIRHLSNQRLSSLEFCLHTAMFSMRKVEESLGIPLELNRHKIELLSWPITAEKKAEVFSTPDPQLDKWYDFKQSTSSPVTYKRLIDIFIHARLCNFSHIVEDQENGVFLSSDHTMKERIFYVTFSDLSAVLAHATNVFAPIEAQRRSKATTAKASSPRLTPTG